MAAAGAVVVGMGRAAQGVLAQAGITHLRLIHPAARGAIRARGTYYAHVAAVLGRTLPPARIEIPVGDATTLRSREANAWR